MLLATVFAVQVLVEKLPKVFEKYHKIDKLVPFFDGLDSDKNLIVIDALVKDAKFLIDNAYHQNIVLFTSENKVVKQFITELGISTVSSTTLKVTKDNYHISANTILDKKPSFTYTGPLLHGTNEFLSYPLITGYIEDEKDGLVGSQLELVRLFQTRNNTRLAILPKEFLDVKDAQYVLDKVLDWTFKLKNVLSLKVEHFKVDEQGNKSSGQLKEYKIKDKIVFIINVASECRIKQFKETF